MKTELTDEQVTRVLAERDWWKFTVISEAEKFYALTKDARLHYADEEDIATLLSDYLTSRDALAPVLDGLSEEEWTKLLDILWVKCGCGFQPTRLDINLTFMRYLLTLPARDLAYAVAQVISA